METSQLRSDDNDIFNQPRLTSGLNVLTILTIIGCVIYFLIVLGGYISAKGNYEKREETLAMMKSEKVPAFFKGMMPDDDVYIKLVTKNYFNRIPIFILSLLSIGLCLFGAIQMRKLKKQGYVLYLVGEILPVFVSIIFIGFFSLSGPMFYLLSGIAILFILLYTVQRKNLVY